MPIVQGPPLIIQIGVNDEPAGSLTATVDEYFWQNPVPPPALSPWTWPQQWTFDEQIPAGTLTATVDEYFWQNPTPPVVGSLYQQLPLGIDEQTPKLFGQYDEDFWQNPVFPVPGRLGPIYLPDPEEIPAASLTATVDEYFWFNPNSPIQYGWYIALPYIPDPEELVVTQAVVATPNYVCMGMHNFVSQDIGSGIEF